MRHILRNHLTFRAVDKIFRFFGVFMLYETAFLPIMPVYEHEDSKCACFTPLFTGFFGYYATFALHVGKLIYANIPILGRQNIN